MGAGGHAFAVLVQDDAAPEKLAEHDEGGVFQEGDAVAGDGQVAGGRAEGQQLPEGVEK